MKKVIKSVIMMSLLGITLVGCSPSTKSVESVNITDEALISSMKETAKETVKQYFEVEIDETAKVQETAVQNIIVDKATGEKEHLSNMFQASVIGEAKEGAVQNYGVVISPDGKVVQGAIINIFSSSKPQKYKEGDLRVIGDQFMLNSGVVEEPSSWEYDGLENSAGNKQFNVLRYKKDDAYLLVGISLQSGKVTYFERTITNKK